VLKGNGQLPGLRAGDLEVLLVAPVRCVAPSDRPLDLICNPVDVEDRERPEVAVLG